MAQFKEGDYIVVLAGSADDAYLKNYCYKQRGDHNCLLSKIDSRGDKNNGWGYINCNMGEGERWRYATTAEAKTYETLKKPFDCSRICDLLEEAQKPSEVSSDIWEENEKATLLALAKEKYPVGTELYMLTKGGVTNKNKHTVKDITKFAIPNTKPGAVVYDGYWVYSNGVWASVVEQKQECSKTDALIILDFSDVAKSLNLIEVDLKKAIIPHIQIDLTISPLLPIHLIVGNYHQYAKQIFLD